jgi:rare lipoprotein A
MQGQEVVMRVFLAAIPAMLALGALTAGPAAANVDDHWFSPFGQDRAETQRRAEQASPRARRTARAYISDWDDDYEEARPKRRYRADPDARPRYTKKRHRQGARSANRGRSAAKRSMRQRSRYVQRSGPRRRTAMERLPVRGHRVRARPAGSVQQGIASYYWQGQRLATGGWFNPDGISAAHRTLPFGTRVRVTHLRNGRSVDVRINDRGPYIAGRVIDLSRGAARVIGMTAQGIAQVRVTVLGR